MTICQVLSCSSDYLLFGKEADDGSSPGSLHSCVPSTKPAFSRALAAFRLPAHSVQLHFLLPVSVSVAL